MLPAHVPATARQAPAGQLDQGQPLDLSIALPLRNQAALTDFLRQIQDPASPNYRHYLTPAEFTARFGPTVEDYQAVKTFAESHGLRVTATHANRFLLDVRGSVADVQSTLHVNLRTYRHPTEHRLFYAPDAAPSLDLATPVLDISGLDNFSLPKPRFSPSHATPGLASPNAGSGPSGDYMGKDFRAAYAPDTTLAGTGQAVGLLEFDGYSASDVTYYEGKAGLPGIPLQNVLIDGATGSPSGSGGEIEVTLDIEMAVSMATNLSQVIVYEAPNGGSWHDLLNRMTTDNLAKQLSCSWYIPGGPMDTVADGIFQEMAAQGQTFFAACGDDDAYTGLIPFPGDTPYVTEVGGTTLTTTGPAGAYTGESVWNWEDGIGGGGGISTQYPIPSWQTNISMASNQGSTTRRNIPDVALTANHMYVRADGEDFTGYGGTSFAAPLWAGFMALVNQQAVATGHAPVGFLNAALDVIGKSAAYTTCFHDVTVGNNESGSSPTKFSAVTGYDLCTGWGTPAGQALINALANPEPLVITPSAGFTSAGGVGGPFTVASQIFYLTNNGTNTLSWSLSTTSVWLTGSPAGGTLPTNTMAAVTVSLTAAAATLPLGRYAGTVNFTNVTDQMGQARAFGLFVMAPPAITNQPVNATALEGESVEFSAAASGDQPLAWQWLENGTNLVDGPGVSGSATPNLVLSSLVASEAGNYAVVVTNAAGAAISSNAVLAIPPSPPVFLFEPTNVTAYEGKSAAFSVVLAGSNPRAFQWQFGPDPIPNATNATLILPNLQLDQSGSYSVTVTNAYGATNSTAATLTVVPAPPCAPPHSGIIGWWAAEGNAYDSIGGNNGSYNGNVTYAPGEVGEAFSLNGACYVAISNAPIFNTITSNLTVEAWIKVTQFTGQDWVSMVCKGDSSWQLRRYGTGSNLSFWTAGLDHEELPGSRSVNDGQWHHIAGVYDGSHKYLYVDGELDASTNATGSITVNTDPLLFGDNPESLNRTFDGLVDEVSVYNQPLSSSDIQAIYSASFIGKCPPVLTITSQPASQTVYAGSLVTFSVGISGPLPVFYQWEFDGTNLFGATNSVLTLTAESVNAGTYSVTITNLSGMLESSNAVLTVLTQPPAITTEPVGETNFIGTTAMFNVTAEGTGPLGYQWLFNGTNLAGATNASLTIGNVQLTNAGVYAVSVTNIYGATLSSNALLSVVAQLPTITSQPAGITNFVGAGVVFSVVAVGTPPLSYQWAFNATNLAGATNATLSLANIQTNQSGNYSVIVSSPYGSTNSAAAFLFVNQTGACDPAPVGMVSWWTGDDNAYDAEGTNNGALAGGVAYGTGRVGDAFNFDGTGGEVVIPDSPSLDALTTNLTVEAWFKVTQFSSQNWIGIVSKSDLAWEVRRYGTSSNLSFWTEGLSTPELAGTRNINDGQWHHFAAVYNGATKYLYVDGTLDVSAAATGSIATNSSALWFGNVPGDSYRLFNGLVDEVAIYNRALSAGEIAAIYGAGSVGKCALSGAPPTITAQPTNQTVTANGTATFSVVANGTPPFGYQWTHSATNLPNATNSSLVLSGVVSSQAGNYMVTVTNLYGATNSAIAVLTVNPASGCDPAPSGLVSWWPAQGSATDVIGTNNGILANGAGYATGEVGQAFSVSGGSYVSVPNPASIDVLTNRITVETWIKVNQFSSQDWIAIVCKGDTSWQLRRYSTSSSLDFWANGLSNPELPGSRNVNDGKWHHIAGVYDGAKTYLYIDGTLDASQAATGSIHTNTDPLWFGDNPEAGQRAFNGSIDEVSIYNRALSANEIAAIYSAGAAGKCPLSQPYIISQPAGQTVVAGGEATFSVTLSGSTPLVCQWLFDGVSIPAATNTTLTLTNVQAGQAGAYAVLVTNLYGFALSSNALLTLAAAPVITLAPANATNIAGSTAGFSAMAAGTPPLAFRWQKNGVNLYDGGNVSESATTNLVVSDVQDADAGAYSIVVTNVAGSITSAPALLTVADLPAIVSQPASQSVFVSSNASFSVTATGSAPLFYQWSFNGAPVTGATNSSLTLTNTLLSQAGTYAVLVDNGYGAQLSSNAVLTVNPLYYFSWNTIPTPRFLRAPFAVVVSARTLTNGLATNFSGFVTLDSTNGIPVTPATSACFFQGVWTGAVTVAQTVTNLVLRATDSLGDTGTANPVDVVNLPALTSIPSGGTLLMLWPASPAGFSLETTPQLFPPAWTSVSTTPFQLGGQYLLSVPTSSTNAYFRLRFSGP